jgi:Na+-driven multidrug efflux pump
MFTDLPEVVDLASRQVRFLALTITGLSVAIVTASSFQAIGKPLPALFLALIRMGLISIPVALILVFTLHLKIYGVYIAIATGNLCAVPIAYFWFRRQVKRMANKTV